MFRIAEEADCEDDEELELLVEKDVLLMETESDMLSTLDIDIEFEEREEELVEAEALERSTVLGRVK